MFEDYRSLPEIDGQLPERSHASRVEGLLPFEHADIRYLIEHVRPLYVPRESPISMVVGASAIREATILREFHAVGFGVPPEKSYVTGCNISYCSPIDRYDQTLLGPLLGDARDPVLWLQSLAQLCPGEDFHYDLACIRNPDLVDVSAWADIFMRAIEYTSRDGVVVSFVRATDSEKLTRLLNILADEYHISPKLLLEDLRCESSDRIYQHSNLVVFKGAPVLA